MTLSARFWKIPDQALRMSSTWPVSLTAVFCQDVPRKECRSAGGHMKHFGHFS